MSKRCQVCDGPIVNGRCKLCGMPYRNDEILYHLNEDRSEHYRHATPKARAQMRESQVPLGDRAASGKAPAGNRSLAARDATAAKDAREKETALAGDGAAAGAGAVSENRTSSGIGTLSRAGTLSESCSAASKSLTKKAGTYSQPRTGRQPAPGSSGRQTSAGSGSAAGRQAYTGSSSKTGRQAYTGSSSKTGRQAYAGSNSAAGRRTYSGSSRENGKNSRTGRILLVLIILIGAICTAAPEVYNYVQDNYGYQLAQLLGRADTNEMNLEAFLFKDDEMLVGKDIQEGSYIIKISGGYAVLELERNGETKRCQLSEEEPANAVRLEWGDTLTLRNTDTDKRFIEFYSHP